MRVIPVIPVRNGKLLGSRDKASKVVETLGFDTVCVIDINGIRSGKPQLELLKALCTVKDIWVDVGVRYAEDVIDPLIAGALYVIISTKTLMGMNELERAFELSENIIVGLDYNKGIVATDPEPRRLSLDGLLSTAMKLGITRYLLVDSDYSYMRFPENAELYVTGHKDMEPEPQVNALLVDVRELMG